MTILACLAIAVPLIWLASHLDGDATRKINKIEDDAAEAAGWLAMMECRK